MPTITTNPLRKAVEQVARKNAVASSMSSYQWEMVPADIRDRAFFSARVEEERLLAEMQVRLQARIEHARRDGRLVDRGVFVEEMREEVRKSGYRRPAGVDRGSVRDLKSTKRLGLIFDMNVAQAQGFARWNSDMTPEGLENEPAYELIRLENRVERRNWPHIWYAAGGRFYGEPGSNPDYPAAPGRMIAKKNDPIWREISRFDTPWPPFDWGSGMGLRGVDRDTADGLGVTHPDEFLEPLSEPLNSSLAMSAKGIPSHGRESLRSTFGDAIKFDGDHIQWQRNHSPETNEDRQQAIDASLQARQRRYYLQASEELERVQREHDGAGLGFQGEGELDVARTHLAQIGAVAVGRKRLFHDTMSTSQAQVLARSIKDLPANVSLHARDGHLIAWRNDLESFTPDDVIDAMQRGEGGLLLGYGRDTMAMGEPHMVVGITRQGENTPVAGFHAPVAGWRSFAEARAKDLASAWGEQLEINWKEVRR